jgi:site-specific DNA-methyltransferase (adenine-specific)/adenine-specific DNA-methyltransferase
MGKPKLSLVVSNDRRKGKIVKSSIETGVIYCADNLAVMKTLPNESIDLIYIDPPFNTRSVQKAVEWDEEVQGLEYYDSYGKGIMSYVAFMKERLQQMHRLLKDSGSLFVHVDYRSVHYLKQALDEIFGQGKNIDQGSKHLINEIIWHYDTFHGRVKKYLPRKHDTILVYSKTKTPTFHRLFDTEVEDTIDGKRWAKYIVNGNQILGKNMPIQDSRFVRYIKRFQKQKGHYPKDEDIVLEINGQTIDDVWDIKAIDPKDKKERIGYPTQKPIELLERIIKIASNEGDVIADFFCGCGTAISAAQKLKRRWIGVDASKKAAKVMRKRMERDHQIQIHESTLEKANLDAVFAMDFKEFQVAMIHYIGGISNNPNGPDGGQDGVMADTGEPIAVNQWTTHSSEFSKFYRKLKKHEQGTYIAYDFTSGVKEEVMRLKIQEGIECRLYTVGDILGIPSDEYKRKLKKHLESKKEEMNPAA